MLVLHRKKGESIMIGNQIEIRILETADGKVKIGIEAPREISILRKEIYLEIIEENQKAVEFQVENLKLIRKEE
jgi:carbon storage regulator